MRKLAAHNRRRAYEERERGERYPPGLADRFAEPYERKAAAIFALPAAPDVRTGGEVANTCSAPDGCVVSPTSSGEGVRFVVRDTLRRGATRIAEDASIRRTDLLLRPSINALALGLDAAESVGAANSIEKMLAHQMALAHEAAMRMMDRGLSYRHEQAGDKVESCRCTNAAARLMSAFNDATLTLQKLRTGGTQTVTVQHVNGEARAQAVIGNVHTGGRVRRGRMRPNE